MVNLNKFWFGGEGVYKSDYSKNYRLLESSFCRNVISIQELHEYFLAKSCVVQRKLLKPNEAKRFGVN